MKTNSCNHHNLWYIYKYMVDITLLDSFIYIAYGVAAGCIVEHTHPHAFIRYEPDKTHATIVNKSHTHT